MPEGFRMKTLGTGKIEQSVQEEIRRGEKKKKDSQVISHVLL